MRISGVLSSLGVVLFCGGAFAQAAEPAVGTAPEPKSGVAAATETPITEAAATHNESAQAAPAQATVPEKKVVQASPEVQTQVGVGTEKEGPVRAGPPKAEPAREATPPKVEPPTDYGHFMQLGARAGVSVPYKIMARFESSPPCEQAVMNSEEEERKVCAVASPPSLDLALSFAPVDAIEPFLWLRMGLSAETETNTKALRVYGAGLRVYTMSDSMVKMFFEPALGVETEGATDPQLTPDAKYPTDFFVHLNFGAQVDFIRYAGIYLALGPNVSFVRAITTTLEANAGLQLRLP